MICYFARSSSRNRVWAFLLISFLIHVCPVPGHAEQTATPLLEVQEILEQSIQAAADVTNPFFRAIVLDAIASAYTENKNTKRALELASRKDNVNQYGTLRAITRVLLKEGQVKHAQEVASGIADGYWKSDSLEKVGLHYVSIGDKQAALNVFREALKAADSIISDDSSIRVRSLLRIAEGQGAAGDKGKVAETVQHALDISFDLQDAHSRDSAIREVAAVQAKLGDVSGALRTNDAIQDGDDKEGSLRDIVSMVARNGNLRYAFDLAATINGAFNHDLALQRIVEAQVHDGDLDGAVATAATIPRSNGSKVIALSRIADEMMARHNRAAALSLLEQAAQVGSQISEAQERARYLGGIARRQAKADDRQRAMVTIRQALQAMDKVSDIKERDSPLLDVVQAQAQAGDFEGALKSTAVMSSDFMSDRAYFQIAQTQAWAGDIKRALQTAALSHGIEFMWRGYSLRRIAEIQTHKGDKKGALAWALTQSVPSDRALALLGVAEGLLHAGKPIDNYPDAFTF